MKKFKKILILIPIIAVLICSLCIPISAATVNGNVYITMPISKPNVSDGFYYVELVTLFNGNYLGWVFLINDNNSYGVDLIVSDKNVSISTYGPSSLIIVDNNGYVFNKGTFTNGGTFNSSFTGSIVGVTAYGNVVNNSALNSGVDFVYGENNISLQLLMSILTTLNGQSNSDIIGSQQQIGNAIQDNQDKNTSSIINNQDQNAQDIQDNQDKNTQSIIDNQNQLVEQEKQEVTDSGNDSVDGAMEVMPSYDLGDVFDGFVNVMHYDGLDCELDIPEIYIPEIPNVTKKVVLYSGGKINFKDYFDMIPNTIILVVRAILTIALILFAFKELWTTIGQVLSGEGIKIMKNGLEGD